MADSRGQPDKPDESAVPEAHGTAIPIPNDFFALPKATGFELPDLYEIGKRHLCSDDDERVHIVRWIGLGHLLSGEQENNAMERVLSHWLTAHPDRSIEGFSLHRSATSQIADYTSPQMIALIHSRPVVAKCDQFHAGERGFTILRFVGAGNELSFDQEDAGLEMMVNNWIASNPDKRICRLTMCCDTTVREADYASPQVVVGIYWLARSSFQPWDRKWRINPNPDTQISSQKFRLARHLVAAWNSDGSNISGEEEDSQARMRANLCVLQEEVATLIAFTSCYQWGLFHAGRRCGPQFIMGLLFQKRDLERDAHLEYDAQSEGVDIIRSVGTQGLDSEQENILAEVCLQAWISRNPDKEIVGLTQQYDHGHDPATDTYCGRYIYGIRWKRGLCRVKHTNACEFDVKVLHALGPAGDGLLTPDQEDRLFQTAMKNCLASVPMGTEVVLAATSFRWGAFNGTDMQGPRMDATVVFHRLC